MTRPQDLVQGTLNLLILKLLAIQPMNGWTMRQRISEFSADVLRVTEGALYPALHKLESDGWIEAEWRLSGNNRRAKFYSLTPSGRRQLRVEASEWDRLAAAISALVRMKETKA